MEIVKLKTTTGEEVLVDLDEVPKEVLLKALLKRTVYVLQKKVPKTGQWTTVITDIQGRDTANSILNRKKNGNTQTKDYRAIQKNEAQKYIEGWEACRALFAGEYYPDPKEKVEALRHL